jgi:hypothetical protein
MTTLFDLPARQTINKLAESIPWNRFLGSLKFYKFGLGSVLEGRMGVLLPVPMCLYGQIS